MDRKLATEFTRMQVQINEPRSAFDMYIAVWTAPGRGECVIGAPSVKALADRWLQITRTALDESRAQHVLVLHCSAPDELMERAKAIAAIEVERKLHGAPRNECVTTGFAATAGEDEAASD